MKFWGERSGLVVVRNTVSVMAVLLGPQEMCSLVCSIFNIPQCRRLADTPREVHGKMSSTILNPSSIEISISKQTHVRREVLLGHSIICMRHAVARIGGRCTQADDQV